MCELTLQMILLCNCSLSLNVFNIGLQRNLQFLSTTVLQGSVATRVNHGKIFNDLFIANLPLSEMVKEFWRSVRIWQSYGKKIKWHLFSGHGVDSVLWQCIVLYLTNKSNWARRVIFLPTLHITEYVQYSSVALPPPSCKCCLCLVERLHTHS